MLNVSTAFKQKLYNDEREYLNTLQFTLADTTSLTVDNEHIMGGGLDFEDAVGEDSSFTALGSTVCNGLTVVLYNLDDIYSDYIFEGAKCVWSTGLNILSGTTETPEMIKKGVFTVDEATYNDYTITLTMLDNMEQFDRPYSLSQLVYPATLDEIVRNACSICDVTLDTNSANFPNKNYIAPVRPEDGSTTFREVLGWCATIAGCFARCNADGKLELKWFDTDVFDDETGYDGGVFDSSTPYSTGDSVNGGTFNPWNTGDSVDGDAFTTNIPFHYITSLNTQSIGVDDTIVTGIRIVVKLDEPDSSSSEQEYFSGSSNYVIEITNNPLITTDTAQSVLNFLAVQLIGLSFRQCNVTHPNDPTIEAGDVGLIWDTRGDEHHILITRVTFAPDSPQTIVCGAETVSKNQSTRVTSQTKSFIEARKQLRKQRDEYQAAMDDLRDAIENANGLYETEVTQQDSSVIRYLHNKPELSESDIQIVISSVGVTMTPDGGDHWYGIQVDGTLIASIMNTIGINFDWGTGGTLTLGGNNNVNGLLRVLNASGTQVGQWDNNGINITKGTINLGNGNFEVTTAGLLSATSATLNGSITTTYSNGAAAKMSAGSIGFFGSGSTSSIGDMYYQTASGDYQGLTFRSNSNINFGLPYDKDAVVTTSRNGSFDASYYILLSNRNNTNGIKLIWKAASDLVAFKGADGNTIYVRETTSDKRLKKNIKNSTIDALSMINAIEHKSFDYKEDGRHRDNGYIAQQLEKVNKEFVEELKQENGSTKMYVNTFELLACATKAIQELSTKVDEQTKEIENLKKRIAKLEILAEKLI